MMGVVFNMLETVVSEQHGEDAWEDLIDASGVSGAYTSIGNYDDAELFALVAAGSKALDVSPPDLLRWFGRTAIPKYAERYPHFFDPHQDARSFILTLNDIIHPEVRKIHPGAECPDFDFQSFPDGRLSMIYRSKKKLCALAEGQIMGAADYYKQKVSIEQPQCMHKGGDVCVISCTFSKAD